MKRFIKGFIELMMHSQAIMSVIENFQEQNHKIQFCVKKLKKYQNYMTFWFIIYDIFSFKKNQTLFQIHIQILKCLNEPTFFLFCLAV